MATKQRDTATDAVDSSNETIQPTTTVEDELAAQLDELRAKALGDFDEVKRVAQSFIHGTRSEYRGFHLHLTLLRPLQEAVDGHAPEQGLAAIQNYLEHVKLYGTQLAQHNEITDLIRRLTPIVQAHGIEAMGKYLLDACRAAR